MSDKPKKIKECNDNMGDRKDGRRKKRQEDKGERDIDL